MIHKAKRRLGARSLILVPVLALFVVVPMLESGPEARADGPVRVVGSRHYVPTLQAAGTETAELASRTRGKVTVHVGAPGAPILPGKTYDWPFTVTNRGASTIEAVTFSTALSKRLDFVSGQDDCSWKHQMAVCRLGPMEQGETRTGTLTAKVADDACSGDTIGGGATVTWGEAPAVKRIETEFPEVKVAPIADLSVVETAPAQVLPGGALPYEITVLNKGLATAEDVVLRQLVRAVLTDAVAGREPVKVTDAPCASKQTGLVCELGSIKSGESRTVKLNVQLDAKVDVGAVIKAPAEVTSPTIDTNAANNDCAPETKVVPILPVRAAIPAAGPGDHVRPEGPEGPGKAARPAGPGAGAPPNEPMSLMGLPHTGAPTQALMGAALGLFGTGLVLLRMSRRRRRRSL